MGGRWRVVALAVVLVGTSALPAAGQDPSGAPTAVPSAAAEPSPVTSATPGSMAAVAEWLPADIAADIDAIRTAATLDDAVAATRTVLERSGVVIAEDPTSAVLTPAALSISLGELESMALEAMAGPAMTRATYDRFAVTFGGAAGLTADDAFRDRLGSLDHAAGPAASPGASAPAPSPATGAPPVAGPGLGDQLDLSSLPVRMTTFLNGWLALALEHHAAPEPELVALTYAPLYVAALASVRPEALDLRAPFSAADLRLGMLEITLLTAGIRAPLAYAQAGILDLADGPRVHLASWRVPRTPAPFVAHQAFSDCDQLKQLIDSRVPLSIVVGLEGKAFIKSMVQRFLENLFGAATTFSRNVGPAFKALGLMFKMAALVMLYEHTQVVVRLEPGFVHKPTGEPILATAIVEAGIPDAEWERAKRQRQDDFWSTALRTCARLLGMPVTSDLIDVGKATDDWVVQWEVRRGLDRHVLVPLDQLVGQGTVTGRLERQLDPMDDHTGTDELVLHVLPEAPENHPGIEYSDPVEVCAHVVPREPPGGFRTFISAGMAGQALAGSNPVSGLVSLAAVLGDLLLAWYREVATLDSCGAMNVSYHVPQPSAWRGRIRVNWESRRETVNSRVITDGWGTGPHGEMGKELFLTRVHDDITDTFFVGGEELPNARGSVELAGRAYVHGIENYFDYHFYEGYSASCHYQQETTFESLAGGWTFEGDARGTLQLRSDGSYTIDVMGAYSPGEVSMPVRYQDATRILGGVEGCESLSVSEESEGFPLVTTARTDRVEGSVDPANPGTQLKGSKRTEWPDGSVTTITWDLTPRRAHPPALTGGRRRWRPRGTLSGYPQGVLARRIPMLSVRDPIRRRQPIERPLDVIGLELLVTVSQALLVGILLSLAAQLGGDARAYGLPVPGLLAVLAIAVGVGWLRWLVGGSGWVMAAVGMATAILTGAMWLLALQDASLPRIDWLVGLLAAACALYGLIAGVFLDGPHRAHWKGGVSQPRRGVPETRATPARFSPPVQKVVDQRLTNVRLPQVSMPSTARLKAVGIPRPTRPAIPPNSSRDGLAIAEDIAPHPTASTHPAASTSDVADGPAASPGPSVAIAPVATTAHPPPAPAPRQEPLAAAASPEPAPPVPSSTDAPTDATEVVGPRSAATTAPDAPEPVGEGPPTGPDAPTQPIARPATEWPRPIEPRTRTGAHKVEPDT